MKKILSFLLVMCLLCSVVPVFAEEAQTFTVGPYTFELPANATLGEVKRVSSDISMFTMSGSNWQGNYEMTGVTYQYKASDVSEQDVMDYQNFYILLALMLGKENMSIMNPMDSYTDMPDGQKLMMGSVNLSDGSVLYAFSHYYDGTGFMLMLTGDSGTWLAARDMAQTVQKGGAAAAGSGSCVVITAQSGKIRSEASVSGGLIKTAYQGETYELIRAEGDWYVVVVNGRTGYIHQGVAAIQ